jgi:hypothetical protein
MRKNVEFQSADESVSGKPRDFLPPMQTDETQIQTCPDSYL